MREPRLGDIIDDYCVKCKRIMNHAVVSLLNDEPAKVRCRTCHNDHDFRHEQPPPPKVDTRKQALFNEVLAKVAPGSAVGPAEAVPFLEEAGDEILLEDPASDEIALEDAPAGDALSEDAEEAPVEAVETVEPAKPAKAKVKKPKVTLKANAKANTKASAKGRK